MKEWICQQCGYTYRGDNAPEQCPRCGYPQSQFYPKKKGGGCFSSMLVIIFFLITLSYPLMTGCSTVTVNNNPVKTMNLDRYLGKWYELARLDHRFERYLTHCTAIYTLNDDGTITVVNRGKKNGKWKTSKGEAKVTDTPGILRVSFFGPFYSDYRVLMLGPDYSYALVGGATDHDLWVLSRTPEISTETRNDIIREACHRGYPTDALIWIEQN